MHEDGGLEDHRGQDRDMDMDTVRKVPDQEKYKYVQGH